MNRRSRMKSTLDSLFSSTKSQAQEPEVPAGPETSEKAEEKSSQKSSARSAVGKKTAAVKTPASTPKTKSAVKKTAEKPKKPSVAVTSKEKPLSAPLVSQPAETDVPVNPPVMTAQVISQPTDVEAPTSVESLKPSVSSPVDMKESQAGTVGTAENKETNAETAAEIAISKDEESDESHEEEHLVVFLLANEFFGISIQMVESIIKKQAITKVPHAEKFILGVTNLRGTVVPVVDLRQRFSMPIQAATKDTRIIVLNTESGKNGIVVDEVVEVMRLPKKAIAPTPMIATTINSAFITGIARTEDKLIILLDANKILQQ
jgi:purine-binding chemotaxis protein CheW